MRLARMGVSSYSRAPPLQDPLPPSLPPPPPPPHLSPVSSKRSILSIAFPLPSVAEEPEQELEEQKETKEKEEKLKQEDEDEDEEEERNRSHCFLCYGWMFFGLFFASFFILTIYLVFVFKLQPALPIVSISKLDFPWLHFPDRNFTLLDANVLTQIQVFNDNEETVLDYGRIKVQLFLDHIQLGETMVAGFSQKAKNLTFLNMRTQVRNSLVNADYAKKLQASAKNNQIVLDIVLSGNIGFEIGLLKMNGMPSLIACQDIKQFEVDFADKPKECKVEIFGFRNI
ncbi:uncharacterized protein LOC110010174 [Jatropha curcas]|uniref:uncharacterized protein LOC110010174 n=1 Tax=Jatropha curcas TaxID=180498 RepID=UPI0009D64C4D|nr:uncharacterized protein LOC110010174 [Jatropha curcas]